MENLFQQDNNSSSSSRRHDNRRNSPIRDRGRSPQRTHKINSISGSGSNDNSNSNSVFSTMYNPMFELMRQVPSRDEYDTKKRLSNDDDSWAADLRKR